jgi:GAF domain-containing protein
MTIKPQALSQQKPGYQHLSSEYQILRAQVLQTLLNFTTILSVIGYFFLAFVFISKQAALIPILLLAPIALLLTITFYKKFPYALRAGVLIAYIFITGCVYLLLRGLDSIGIVLFVIIVQAAFTFFGHRMGVLTFIVCSFTVVIIGFSHQYQWVSYLSIQAVKLERLETVYLGVGFILINTFLAFVLRTFANKLNLTLIIEQSLTHQLDLERLNLENSIQERTELLQRHTNLMEAASQVAHKISQESNRDVLFRTTIELILERFGFYYAAIFLMDENDEYAVLVSANGEAGQKMIELGHKLKKGEEGIVGNVVYHGRARIAHDVGLDAVHFKNPHLPFTRSEMALPLRSGNKILGALDVQSTDPEAYTEIDIKVLQTIADQLAVALDKVNLLEKLHQSIEDLEASVHTNTKNAWNTHLRSSRSPRGYSYNLRKKTLTTYSPSTPHPGLSNRSPQTDKTLHIPITVRDQTIGVIDLHFDGQQIPGHTVNLVKETANRMGLALETARLLDELRLHAEQEQMVSQLSSQVRSSSDVDQILRTTVMELQKNLNLREVVVQLCPSTEESSLFDPEATS